MVMHARKQPRLSDGYADRKEAHLHQVHVPGVSQTVQYPPGAGAGVLERPQASPFERVLLEDSPSNRHSPRYQSKLPHLERGKEKEKKTLVAMPDKRVNHQGLSHPGLSGGSSRGNGQSRYHDVQDRSGAGSSGAAKAMGRDQREHRAEQVQKYAVRVCGDWSEHISSSGKRYYYNCKTEVSQWEKPKEWVDGEPDRLRDVKGHYRQSTSRSAEEAAKHCGPGERNDRPRVNSDSATYKPLERPLVEKPRPYAYPQGSHLRDANLNSSIPSSSSSSSLRTPNANHRSVPSSESGYSKEVAHHPDLRKNSAFPYSVVDPNRKRPRLENEGNRPAYTTQATAHHRHEEHGGHGEDMEISPESTPTSRNCTQQLAPALQTLQKLQEALNMHIVRTQNNMGAQTPQNSHHQAPPQQSPHSQSQAHLYPHRPPSSTPTSQPLLPYSSSTSTPTPTASTSAAIPHSVTSQLVEQEERAGQESPISDMSPRSSSQSPVLSDGSSQNAPLGTSALSGAAIKKEQSVELTPSLANYYNERLIGHVMGWQADYAERQAQRYWQEAITTSSQHCSQVSVELKKSRSLVRVGEIQATLHEQRMMFLDRQIKEIDSMKIPSSFLPP